MQDNITAATRLIHDAVEADARLVLLPEYWAFMGMHEQDKVGLAKSPDAALMSEFMAQQAREHGIYLIGGTIPIIPSASPEMNKETQIYSLVSSFN